MKQLIYEAGWDKLLKVKTSGRDDSHSDQYRYPYEPTPYEVLERLANSGYIGKKNMVVDYGCGKGRVSYFLSWQLRCRCTGVEYDDRIFEAAAYRFFRTLQLSLYRHASDGCLLSVRVNLYT